MLMSWLEVAWILSRLLTSNGPSFPVMSLCCMPSFVDQISAGQITSLRNECQSMTSEIRIFDHILMLSLPLLSSLFSFLHLDVYGLLPKNTASAESANGTSITQTSLNKNANRLSVSSLYLVVVCTTVEIVV